MVALLEVNDPGELQTESIYRLVIVAGIRSKQLMRGSTPRIEANVLKRKNTSIALEEVRRGLVRYTKRAEANGSSQPKAIIASGHSVEPFLNGA